MPERVALRPVFTLDGRTFSWGDLVGLARLDGSWAEVETSARRGLAALTPAGRPSPGEVLEAGKRFRYARNLLAGEELSEWLEHWGLTMAAWRAYVERQLVEPGPDGGAAVAEGEPAEEVWAEAVCSGFLERLARRVAGERALALAGGAQGVTDEAIAREVSLHRLEWLRVEGRTLTVPLEDTAREAALCVREDGRSLEDVARDCGTEARRLDVYAGDAAPGLSSALVAAQAGDLVGPLPVEAGFALVLVDRKTTPAADDPGIRARAEDQIVRRAVERALLDHVEWHERV